MSNPELPKPIIENAKEDLKSIKANQILATPNKLLFITYLYFAVDIMFI